MLLNKMLGTAVKRAGALMLALVLLLGCAAPVFAAETTDEAVVVEESDAQTYDIVDEAKAPIHSCCCTHDHRCDLQAKKNSTFVIEYPFGWQKCQPNFIFG